MSLFSLRGLPLHMVMAFLENKKYCQSLCICPLIGNFRGSAVRGVTGKLSPRLASIRWLGREMYVLVYFSR